MQQGAGRLVFRGGALLGDARVGKSIISERLGALAYPLSTDRGQPASCTKKLWHRPKGAARRQASGNDRLAAMATAAAT